MTLATLLPPSVRIAEDRGLGPLPALAAVEEPAVRNAVPARRAEFTRARACARAALQALGFPASPIPQGEGRQPCWPPGVVGSITHCPGYHAAAVAKDRELSTLGIDAEVHAALPSGVLELIASPPERAQLARLERVSSPYHCDRLLFSVKESVFKAWYPLIRTRIDAEQIRVSLDPLNESFTATVTGASPREGVLQRRFHGRFALADGLLFTTALIQ